jgi:hypothetical protein
MTTEELARDLHNTFAIKAGGPLWGYLDPRDRRGWLAVADQVQAVNFELEECQKVCQSLADRVAKQSELLSRRAEKPNPAGPAAPPGG